jgi:hypothetical protein
MTKTKPPCYHDGNDCDRRSPECRATCEAWQKWLVVHAEEHDKMKRNKNAMLDCDRFLAQQNKRAQKRYRAEHSKAVREGRK